MLLQRAKIDNSYIKQSLSELPECNVIAVNELLDKGINLPVQSLNGVSLKAPLRKILFS